jgi:hypothetical protein
MDQKQGKGILIKNRNKSEEIKLDDFDKDLIENLDSQVGVDNPVQEK